MKIKALKCLDCGDLIFSRAHYDFRQCSCGNCFIDGGFDYCRVGSTGSYTWVEINFNATKQELYQDWNYSLDKFGLIRGSTCLQ